MKDLIIIGAGQAGLTMGYYLKQEGYNFYYLRQETELGIHGEIDMILYSSSHRENIVVYGMVVKGEGKGFPHKDEIATYLEEYARRFKLPIQLQTEVFKIKKEKDIFELHTPKEILQSKRLLSQQVAFSDRTSLIFTTSFIACFSNTFITI